MVSGTDRRVILPCVFDAVPGLLEVEPSESADGLKLKFANINRGRGPGWRVIRHFSPPSHYPDVAFGPSDVWLFHPGREGNIGAPPLKSRNGTRPAGPAAAGREPWWKRAL